VLPDANSACSASSAFLCVLGVKPNAANHLAQSTQRYAEFAEKSF
jgi:hypothetical protein